MQKSVITCLILLLSGCGSRYPGIPKTAVRYYDQGKEHFETYRTLKRDQGEFIPAEEKEKKIAEAIELSVQRYFDAVKLADDFADAYAAIGRSFFETMLIQRAKERDITKIRETIETNVARALELDPELGEAHYVRGVLALDGGDTTAALASLEKCAEFDPNYADAHLVLGQVYNDLSRIGDAINSLEKVMALEPDYRDNLYNLGMLYMSAGKYGKAADQFKAAVDIDQRDVRSKINYAIAIYKAGDEENAMKTINLIVAQKPKDYLTYASIGMAFLELDANMDLAVEFATKSFELKSNYPVSAYVAGDAYFKLGDFQKAYEWYTKAYKLARAPEIKHKMELAKSRMEPS